MPPRRILVPIDFSPFSEAALEAAAMIACGSNGELLVVHVKEPQTLTEGFEDLYPSSEPRTDDLFVHLKCYAPHEGRVPVEHRLLLGAAADTILDLATSEKVDMIVMGTHGRRGLARLLTGSVAAAVARRAECSVLLVKIPTAAAATALE